MENEKKPTEGRWIKKAFSHILDRVMENPKLKTEEIQPTTPKVEEDLRDKAFTPEVLSSLRNSELRYAISLSRERKDRASLNQLRNIIQSRLKALPHNSLYSTEDDYWTYVYAQSEINEALNELDSDQNIDK